MLPPSGTPAIRAARPDPRHEAAVAPPPTARLLAVSAAIPSVAIPSGAAPAGASR
jgi:hypothetical protein